MVRAQGPREGGGAAHGGRARCWPASGCMQVGTRAACGVGRCLGAMQRTASHSVPPYARFRAAPRCGGSHARLGCGPRHAERAGRRHACRPPGPAAGDRRDLRFRNTASCAHCAPLWGARSGSGLRDSPREILGWPSLVQAANRDGTTAGGIQRNCGHGITRRPRTCHCAVHGAGQIRSSGRRSAPTAATPAVRVVTTARSWHHPRPHSAARHFRASGGASVMGACTPQPLP